MRPKVLSVVENFRVARFRWGLIQKSAPFLMMTEHSRVRHTRTWNSMLSETMRSCTKGISITRLSVRRMAHGLLGLQQNNKRSATGSALQEIDAKTRRRERELRHAMEIRLESDMEVTSCARMLAAQRPHPMYKLPGIEGISSLVRTDIHFSPTQLSNG